MLLARFALHPTDPSTSLPHRTPSPPGHLRTVHQRLRSGYYQRPDVVAFVAHRLVVPLLAPEPPMA